MIEKILIFVRWVFTPEQLPGSSESKVDRRGDAFLPWLLDGDTLPEPKAVDQAPTRRRGFFGWVLTGEYLACSSQPPDASASSPSFVRSVLAAEACPELKVSPKAPQPGLALWLLASEECPREAVSDSPRGSGFARRLLESETCPRSDARVSKRRAGFFRWLISSDSL